MKKKDTLELEVRLTIGLLMLIMAMMFFIVKYNYLEQADNLTQAKLGIPIAIGIGWGCIIISTTITKLIKFTTLR